MCTVEKRGRVYLITLTGAGEDRLGPALISALRSAVASVDGGVDDVVAAAVATAERLAARGWDGEVVAEIRKAMWPAVWGKVKDYGADAAAARARL